MIYDFIVTVQSQIVVYYFGRALSSPFEVKVTDEDIKSEGFKLPQVKLHPIWNNSLNKHSFFDKFTLSVKLGDREWQVRLQRTSERSLL
jgi:hypothetical protein